MEITGDPDGIARVWQEKGGNWSIGNSGYGQVTIRVTANDKGGAAAEHTFSFVSPVQSVSVALETHPDGILGIGETDRARSISLLTGRTEGISFLYRMPRFCGWMTGKELSPGCGRDGGVGGEVYRGSIGGGADKRSGAGGSGLD